MIGITKMAMRKMVDRKLLHEEELRTLLVEVENIVNLRPLTYVTDEPCEIIRPIDLICSGMQGIRNHLLLNKDEDEDYGRSESYS
ncbi:unnamed protein product [Dracunculus medinensis]|uniref:Cytochrome P450 n=1 Tax=Dracunculus medinensis TaxID=318479 RepID=A0A0N4UFW4_DRAME|nr:unnamed protein product [Dracunculus medinensis]